MHPQDDTVGGAGEETQVGWWRQRPGCAHVKISHHVGGVCQHFSLLERRHDVAEADLPLPLAAIDSERERLIFEKDEEVRHLFLIITLPSIHPFSIPALRLAGVCCSLSQLP